MFASQPRRRSQSMAKESEVRLAKISYHSKSLRIVERLPSSDRLILCMHIHLQSPQKAL